MKTVTLAAGLGFYGDSIAHVKRSVEANRPQYVCSDHLGELTLSILQKDRNRDGRLGYTRDLVPLMNALWPITRNQKTRFILNAGGLNPAGAGHALRDAFHANGYNARIAVVEGDDVLDRLEALREHGEPLANLDTGEAVDPVLHKFSFANAYLGAKPLVEALQTGADIVVTGRVADACLFLAPLIHEFGWGWDEYDKLAQGLVVGHLLECSGQVSGGNFGGEWESINDLAHLGYPVATVEESGAAVIHKAAGSGGRIDFDSVRQQLLYEVNDPRAYASPDVVLDISSISLVDLGNDKVRVEGATGKPRPDRLKLVAGYPNGFMASAMLGYSWPDAMKKAKAAAAIVEAVIAESGARYDEMDISYLGFDALHGPLSDQSLTDELNEVFLRVAVKVRDRKLAAEFGKHFPWMMVGGPPFVAALPNSDLRELTSIWPTLVARELVEDHVRMSMIET
ncbi:hypothetical protein UB46_33130 [Burkholderiaceae bacterium 16]|nr:hypothetical protein UB46_33130 [Burkholderiaceae bacterium 16]